MGQGIAFEKGGRSQQVRFLAVGDHHQHVARRLAAGLERPHCLQHRGDANGVVRRPGRVGYAVVVGHQRQGWQGGVLARQHAHQVFHEADVGPLVAAARAPDPDAAAHLGRQAHRRHPREDGVAGGVIGG